MTAASSSHQQLAPTQLDQTVKVGLQNCGAFQAINFTSRDGESTFKQRIKDSISFCMGRGQAKFMVLSELNPKKHKLFELPKNVKLTHPKEFTHQYTRALAILHDDSEWDLVGGRGITIKLFPGRYAGDGVDWNERKTFWREGFVCKYVPRRAPTPSNPAQKPSVRVRLWDADDLWEDLSKSYDTRLLTVTEAD